MKMLVNEADREVKIKIEISKVDYKFQKKGRQAEVVELAINALKDYQRQIEGTLGE